MDSRMRMYYRKKMSGGRSIVARITDFIILRALMLFILFFVFVRIWRSLSVALVLALLITAAFSFAMVLVHRARAERYMHRDLQRLKKKCLLEELTLMRPDAFRQYMAQLLDADIDSFTDTEYGFSVCARGTQIDVLHNHPTSVCGVAEILHICRRYSNEKKRVIMTLSSFDKDAQNFAAAFEPPITLIDGEHVLKIAESKTLLPDEAKAWEKAEAEMKASFVTMAQIRKSALEKTKTRAYIICGIIIMCWPLVAGFRFYYPIIAAACFALAVISYRQARKSASKNEIGIY